MPQTDIQLPKDGAPAPPPQKPAFLRGLLNMLPSPRTSFGTDDDPQPAIDSPMFDEWGRRHMAIGGAPMPGAGLGSSLASAEEELPAMGKAAKDLGSSAVNGLKAAAERMGHISETRWAELASKFGGLGK